MDGGRGMELKEESEERPGLRLRLAVGRPGSRSRCRANPVTVKVGDFARAAAGPWALSARSVSIACCHVSVRR